MKILIAGISCILFFPLLAAQNLLLNGDFESGTSNWFMWADSANGYAGSWVLSSSQVHSGSNAAQIRVNMVDTNEPNTLSRIWHVQFQYVNGISVNEGEELLLRFWMKSSVKKRLIQTPLSKNSPNWDTYDQGFFDVSDQWEQYEINFMAPSTTSDIRLGFNLAVDTATFYLDDVELIRTGRMIKDDWYQKAESRIDSLRKGDFSFSLQDSVGNPLNGYGVKVFLRKHHFTWGTALTLEETLSPDEIWYRETASQYFNGGVFENAFKWPFMEPLPGQPDYADVDRYLDWADSLGWKLRGHALIWGGPQAWQSPSWIWSLPPDSILGFVEERVKRETHHYRGQIVDYDVLNEALHETGLADMVGDSVNSLVFDWALQSDPNAQLTINDYNILTGADRGRYAHQIQKMINRGNPVGAIGVQGHFGRLEPWWNIRMRLDFMARLGLPIKITEFDVDVANQGLSLSQQAEAFGQMMRISFSHPQVTDFLFWGFWDGRHWKQDAGIFEENKSPKPAADTVFHLIHKHWTTADSGLVDANGKFNFRGFYGEYEVFIDSLGISFPLYFDPNHTDTTWVLNSGTTAIHAPENRLGFRIFPNPAGQTVHVSINHSGKPPQRLALFDMMGQRLWEQTPKRGLAQYHYQIDMRTFPKGLYILKLQTENEMISKKFVRK